MSNIRIKIKPANIYAKGVLPKDLSELKNTTYFVQDQYYNHTDNNFTDEYKAQLDETKGIDVKLQTLENIVNENNATQLTVNEDLRTRISNNQNNINSNSSNISNIQITLNNNTSKLEQCQNKIDDSLLTTDKSIVGSINELYNSINEIPDIKLNLDNLSLQVSSNTETLQTARNELDQLSSRLDNLEEKGGYLNSYNFNSSPTQEQLSEYAYQELGSEDIIGGTKITNLYDNHTWIYNSNTNKWSDMGNAIVDTASNSKLGIVKGSDADYKISIDLNGEMSVNNLVESLEQLSTELKEYIDNKILELKDSYN